MLIQSELVCAFEQDSRWGFFHMHLFHPSPKRGHPLRILPLILQPDYHSLIRDHV